MFDDMKQQLSASFSEVISQSADKVIEIVPLFSLALIVLIVGIIVAHLVKKAVLHFFDFIALDKLAGKVNVDKALRTIGIHRSASRIIASLVYWLLILLCVLIMSELLKFQAASDAIGAIVMYVPNLITGLLILIVGLLVGRFFRDVLSTSIAKAGFAASSLIGYIAQVIIVIFIWMLALKQFGFDVSVITTHLAVILGVVLVSVGLAIAIAIRPVLEGYFVSRQLKNHLQAGDQIQVEDLKGTVKEVALTSVILEQDPETDVILPARDLFSQRITRKRSRE